VADEPESVQERSTHGFTEVHTRVKTVLTDTFECTCCYDGSCQNSKADAGGGRLLAEFQQPEPERGRDKHEGFGKSGPPEGGLYNAH